MHRLFFIWAVLQYVLDPAAQCAAQVVERGRGDVAALLERIQRAAAERVVFDERISCNALAPHRLPKGLI